MQGCRLGALRATPACQSRAIIRRRCRCSPDTRPSGVKPMFVVACHLQPRSVTPAKLPLRRLPLRWRTGATTPWWPLAVRAAASAAGPGSRVLTKGTLAGASRAAGSTPAEGCPRARLAASQLGCCSSPPAWPPTAAVRPGRSALAAAVAWFGPGEAAAVGPPGGKAAGAACCSPIAAATAAVRCVSRVAARLRRWPVAASPSSSWRRSLRLGHSFSWPNSAACCSRLRREGHGAKRTVDWAEKGLDNATPTPAMTWKMPHALSLTYTQQHNYRHAAIVLHSRAVHRSALTCRWAHSASRTRRVGSPQRPTASRSLQCRVPGLPPPCY